MNQKPVPEEKSSTKRWIIILVVLLVLGLLSMGFAAFMALYATQDSGFAATGTENVALIPIHGEIMTDTSSSLFSSGGASSTDIVKLIKKAGDDPNIKAIVFEINSPGGSPVGSEEIANAIKNVNKTTVSYIRDVGASGAYWVASSTNKIYASKASITGSIGVEASYIEFAGLMNRYNVTYRKLTGGKYKDIGTPYRELTPYEEQMLQDQIDVLYNYFIDEVAANRHMDRSKVEDLATGMFYVGAKAKELGLIDEIGGKEEVKQYLEQKLNTTVEFVEMKPQKSFFDLFSEKMDQQSYMVGRGIGDSIVPGVDSAQSVKVST